MLRVWPICWCTLEYVESIHQVAFIQNITIPKEINYKSSLPQLSCFFFLFQLFCMKNFERAYFNNFLSGQHPITGLNLQLFANRAWIAYKNFITFLSKNSLFSKNILSINISDVVSKMNGMTDALFALIVYHYQNTKVLRLETDSKAAFSFT